MDMFEGFGFGETMGAQAAAYVCWDCGLCPPPEYETTLPEYPTTSPTIGGRTGTLTTTQRAAF